MKYNLTLVVLTPEQIARAREANGGAKRITHALVCGAGGQMFGTERQCLKYFTLWDPDHRVEVAPGQFQALFADLFDKAVKTTAYPVDRKTVLDITVERPHFLHKPKQRGGNGKTVAGGRSKHQREKGTILSDAAPRHDNRRTQMQTGRERRYDLPKEGGSAVLARVCWDDPALMASTLVGHAFSLRLCIINRTTTWEDVRETLESIERFGREALDEKIRGGDQTAGHIPRI